MVQLRKGLVSEVKVGYLSIRVPVICPRGSSERPFGITPSYTAEQA